MTREKQTRLKNLFTLLLTISMSTGYGCGDDSECNNGDRQCSPDGIPQICRNGEWTTRSACDEFQVCSNGRCVDAGVQCGDVTCTAKQRCDENMQCVDSDETSCKNGATKCADKQHLLVCKDNTWSEPEECPAHFECNNKECVKKSPECEAGKTKCESTNSAMVCNDEGYWDSTSCPEGSECNVESGICEFPECEDGQKQCADVNTEQVCKNGHWENSNCKQDSPIKEYCDETQCAIRVCTDDSEYCSDGYLITCTQGAKPKQTLCDIGKVCDSTINSCVSLCTITEKTCADNTSVQSCLATMIPEFTICESGTECDQGECKLRCTENKETCSEDKRQILSCATGMLETVKTTCPSGTLCNPETLSCETADKCENGIQDADELAVDCGGSCPACKECLTYADCDVQDENGHVTRSGFCDAAKGFVCSKKCLQDSDCLGDDTVCRADGRCVPAAFEAILKTTKNSQTVTLPAIGNSLKYKVLWGDEETSDFDSVSEQTTSNPSHTYNKPGEYTLKIQGNFLWGLAYTSLEIPEDSAVRILTRVNSYGTVNFVHYAFSYAKSLTHVPSDEVPYVPISKNGFNGFFWDAGSFDGPVALDTSHATSLYGLFAYTDYNHPIKLDTSNVTNMSAMFYNAAKFNQKVSFDTRNVRTMSGMFSGAQAFNNGSMSDTSQNPIEFNTDNVTNMSLMFERNENLTVPIQFTNTSKVTNFWGFLWDSPKFNHPLDFDTSSATNMSAMFYGASSFNQKLSFNTKNVIDMSYMFADATKFNNGGANNAINFDTSNVIYMNSMFANATNLSAKIDFTDTSKVLNFSYFLYNCANFDHLLNLKTSHATDMRSMFEGASKFNHSVSSFDTENVKYMTSMFAKTDKFNQDISHFKLNKDVYIYNIFYEANAMSQKNVCKFAKKYYKATNPDYDYSYTAYMFGQDYTCD